MRACSRCKVAKPDEDFCLKDKKSGKRQSICRACYNIYKRQHYLEHKQDYVEKAVTQKAEQRARNARFATRVKGILGCVDCPTRDPAVLDFDHLGNKTLGISQAVSRPWSIAKIKEEMRKCVVRCSNCHRKITLARRSVESKRLSIRLERVQLPSGDHILEG